MDILVSANGTVGIAQFRSHYDGTKYWNSPECVFGYDIELSFQDKDITHWAELPKPPENAL